MIAIIDYGMGNLKSVQNAFAFLGLDAVITSDKKTIMKASKIVLPGVGAFQHAIETIRKEELDKIIMASIAEGKPFLGICLGMQLLFEKSYENGEWEGLSILKGEIKKLKDMEKIPHMAWNSLQIHKKEPLFQNLETGDFVYFVHSYYLETSEPIVSATVTYGKEIQIAVQKDNIFALQFHPEKSGEVGLTILKNFGGL